MRRRRRCRSDLQSDARLSAPAAPVVPGRQSAAAGRTCLAEWPGCGGGRQGASRPLRSTWLGGRTPLSGRGSAWQPTLTAPPGARDHHRTAPRAGRRTAHLGYLHSRQ
jgi:hypothetical protein